MGFFSKIFAGLKKTKDSLSKKLAMIFGNGELDDDFFEELEYVLISADMGVETSEEIIQIVRDKCRKQKIKTQEEFKNVLKQTIVEILTDVENPELKYPAQQSVNLQIILKIIKNKLC